MSRESELESLQMELELHEGLPHLFAFKWYPWAREFFECRNKIALLCAGNQISKSSTQIRTCIEWATNKDIWPELWPGQKPNQFWYLYPSQKVVNAEFKTKWMQFLPTGKYKKSARYGWRPLKNGSDFIGVEFSSGIILNFKTYSQKEEDLQSGTCFAIFCFVAGTLIATPQGLTPVEKIKTGDLVLSKDGWAKVTRTQSDNRKVYEVLFSNGETLRGTYEHPIWTKNRGWVQLGDLSGNDICVTVPLWKLIKKLYCLKEYFTPICQRTPTKDKVTTQEGQTGSISTLLSGSRIVVERFQRTMLSIIEMVIQKTIGSRISSYLPEQSTPLTIKDLSGSLKKSFPIFAKLAEKNSYPEPQETTFLNVVRRGVVSTLIWQKAFVGIVKRFLSIVRMPGECTVLGLAQIGEPQEIFNLEVEGSHTYYANGVLTHNCDEETPVKHYSELMFRISACDGYFRMCFTATLGQEFWRQVLEPRDDEPELLPHAWKKQISLFEAMEYEDGTPSHWTKEKIQIVMHRCPTHDEVMRRVYGKFVVPLYGRKYPAFDSKRHFIKPHRIPDDWEIYSGVDPGSGGNNHPAAIIFTAVSPKYDQGRIIAGWRGDGIGSTTAGDVFERYLAIKNERGFKPVRQFYDHACKDFKTISERTQEHFEGAEKSHEVGDDIINLLFKHDMLLVFSDDPELQKFGREISSIKSSTLKGSRQDDLTDAARYSITKIPWNLDRLKEPYIKPLTEIKDETYEEQCLRERRERHEGTSQERFTEELEYEFEELNSLFGED